MLKPMLWANGKGTQKFGGELLGCSCPKVPTKITVDHLPVSSCFSLFADECSQPAKLQVHLALSPWFVCFERGTARDHHLVSRKWEPWLVKSAPKSSNDIRCNVYLCYLCKNRYINLNYLYCVPYEKVQCFVILDPGTLLLVSEAC